MKSVTWLRHGTNEWGKLHLTEGDERRTLCGVRVPAVWEVMNIQSGVWQHEDECLRCRAASDRKNA